MLSQSPGNGFLQSSLNFIWNTADILGKGATASVHLGRHKETGDKFAIKVFNERVSRYFSGICSRELEVLRRMKHINVIALHTIEKETVSQNEILVMEYCAGGSLYQMLELPENVFGFQEEEFLIVFTHIVNGMEYLRQHGLIHRDIKPGNIMRHIGEDGRSIYKLTDFGAARQLEDSDTFTSIFGTEEYLHPGMYEKAVLQHQTGQRFDSSVDLWSIGVTLYHVATGQLPFQPYGGRSNTHTMFQITSEKKSGILSGVQVEENGPIIWSSEMPSTCLLSNSLKRLITPMLACLMESNPRQRLDFPTFFQTVHSIENMIRLNVFFCQAGHNLVIYICKHDTYSSLQEKLALMTDLAAGEQLILVWGRELADIVELTAEIQNYPTAILHGILFLYQREKPEKQRLVHPNIPPFPDISSCYYDKQKHVAKRCLGVAYYIERVATDMIKSQHYSIEAETIMRTYVRKRISHLQSCLPVLSAILDGTRDRQTTFYSLMEKIVDLLNILKNEEMSEYVRKLQNVLDNRTIRIIMDKANRRCEEIKEYMRVLTERVIEQESIAISTRVGCQEEDHCLSKIAHFRENIGCIWKKFCEDRKMSGQSSYEEFLNKNERAKLEDYCIKLQSVVTDHCLYNSFDCYNVANIQFDLLTKNLQRIKKAEQNLSNVMDCMKQLSEKLSKIQNDSLETISVAHVCIQMVIPGMAPRQQTSVQGENVEFSKLELQNKEMTKLQNLVHTNTDSLEKVLKLLESTVLSPESSWNLVTPASVDVTPCSQSARYVARTSTTKQVSDIDRISTTKQVSDIDIISTTKQVSDGVRQFQLLKPDNPVPIKQGSENNAMRLDLTQRIPDGSEQVIPFSIEHQKKSATDERVNLGIL